MEKTIVYRIVVAENDVDDVSDTITDALIDSLEGVVILGPTVRDATEKEKRRYKKEIEDK